eukprot:gb/GECG01003687.1/.p1 GENE.gb/GECG01003687.1/~~gb/GECG01003687.1/.p1  ORF type:complete len:390 (+),score=22.69 gb/GECG01003687.1/:1-1170(+)
MEGGEEHVFRSYLSWLQHYIRPTDDHSIDVGSDSPCAPVPGEILYWMKVEATSEEVMIRLEDPRSARSWQTLMQALSIHTEDCLSHHFITCSLSWPSLVIPVNSDWDCQMLLTKLLPKFEGMVIIDTSYGPEEEDNLAFLNGAKSLAVLPYTPPMQHILLDDHGFRHFSELTCLYIADSNYTSISDGLFQHMTKLSELNMRGCCQSEITDVAFTHMPHLTRLDISECDQETLSDNGFQQLCGLRHLSMRQCTQTTLSDRAFEHLSRLTCLDIHDCNQSTISDRAFKRLQNLRVLDMGGCSQETINDLAFFGLQNLKALYMDGCTQTTITDDAFQHLRNLTFLSITSCKQPTLTERLFLHLPYLRTVFLRNSSVEGVSLPPAVVVRGSIR